MRRWGILVAALLVILSAGAASSAAAESPIAPSGVDWEAPIVESPGSPQATGAQSVFDDDPLGLVPKLPFVQRYSLDTDHFEVWLCGNTSYTMQQALNDLDDISYHYEQLSSGLYSIEFSAGGTIADDPHCLSGFQGTDPEYSTVGTPEGLFIIDPATGGGYASPGFVCLESGNCDWIGSTFPDNGRYAVVGDHALANYPSVAAHEIGHTLQWPHSNSGQSEYDNPIDLMSGNTHLYGGTEPDPYATLAFNRYQSGWIDPGDVVVAGGGYQQFVLEPFTADGIQMVVVLTDTPGVFYTLGSRSTSYNDPIPHEWKGVEVYKIDHTCSQFPFPCPGIYRTHTQTPPDPDGTGHVLRPNEGAMLEGIHIEVVREVGSGYEIIIGDPDNPHPFIDISSSQFIDDIVWLEGESITKGCNPPSNSRYCPASTITRGEMAAFLVRALGLTDDGGGNSFSDDDGSVFENDIAKLAAAGITKGCNPPANTEFCPNDRVTRGQMAAFLARAYGLAGDGDGDSFSDDDGSVFENDIAKLAAAGITKGCNPPANTEFCPHSAVTREQMAAFLHRASSG